VFSYVVPPSLREPGYKLTLVGDDFRAGLNVPFGLPLAGALALLHAC